MSDTAIFGGWSGLVRVAVVGALAHVALVALLRVPGKRTLSKMNAFDLVVTVALGSMLATIILSKSTALIEGVLAMALLIGLQLTITWLSVRSSTVGELVTSGAMVPETDGTVTAAPRTDQRPTALAGLLPRRGDGEARAVRAGSRDEGQR